MTTVELAHQELLIGGRWTGARSGREYEQSFPYTGDQVGSAAAAGREDAQAAVDAAGVAFGGVVPERAGGQALDPVEGGRPAAGASARDRGDRRRGDRRRIRLGHVQRRARGRDAARGGGAGVRPGRRGDPLRRPRQARDGRPGALPASSSGSRRGTRR